jgi:L-asparaginase
VPESMPTVHLLTMGGTISAGLAESGGYSPAIGGVDLVRGLPVDGVAEIRAEEFSRSLSFSASYRLVRGLVSRLSELELDTDVSGVVVTHGTGALEEVAYLCDLTCAGKKPIVFTGATYHATDPGRDGPHNVLDAVRVAAALESRGRGVMVCFAGEVHAARDAVKLHKYSPAAFVSPNGPIGLVDAGGVTFYRHPTGRALFPFPPLPLPHVEVIKAVLDMDDLFFNAALQAHVAGIVVEGFPGSGGVPPILLGPIRDALDRAIPVVLTSRSPFGRITPVARGESGPKVLAEMGVIMGGDLPPQKARLLATVALGNGQGIDQLRKIFQAASRGGGLPYGCDTQQQGIEE